MATPAEITAFRLLIDEQDGTTYTDALISDRLDASENENALASMIWLEKAAKYARLVDIQEGTSRRSLSQLQEHALLMARTYAALVVTDIDALPSRQTQTRAIERV